MTLLQASIRYDTSLFGRPVIAYFFYIFFHQAIHVEAPLCLLKLEFLLPEEKFVSSVEEAEKTLQQEKQQLQRKQNVKETLKKHKVCLIFLWVAKQHFFLMYSTALKELSCRKWNSNHTPIQLVHFIILFFNSNYSMKVHFDQPASSVLRQCKSWQKTLTN